jgi:hypothetical protein
MPVLLGLKIAWVLAILYVVNIGSLNASIFSTYRDCIVAWSMDIFQLELWNKYNFLV